MIRFWRVEWHRTLRQKETYFFLIAWLVVLILLGGLSQALPVATDYTNISSTLLTIIGLILPLFVLLMTAVQWGSERESKRIRLYRTYRIHPFRLIWTRFSTFVMTQWIVLLFAIGVASFFVSVSTHAWLGLFLYAVGLIVFCASLGTWIGTWSRSRLQAVIIAFFTWMFLVLLWPTLLVTIVSFFPYDSQLTTMIVSTLLNGTELLRIFMTARLAAPDVFGGLFEPFMGVLAGRRGILLIVAYLALSSCLFLYLAMRGTTKEE